MAEQYTSKEISEKISLHINNGTFRGAQKYNTDGIIIYSIAYDETFIDADGDEATKVVQESLLWSGS